MRVRRKNLGDRNICGHRIEMKRKELGFKQKDLLAQMQINGIDLNASGLSKLEGQTRSVSDYELKVISQILGTSVNWLLDIDEVSEVRGKNRN